MAFSEAEIEAFVDPRRNPQLRALMHAVGDDIAGKAKRAAPKRRPRSQGGANSIRAEEGAMRTGEFTVNVSWDKDHFYMSFQEFGTTRIAPQAFLLGAAAGYRTRRIRK